MRAACLLPGSLQRQADSVTDSCKRNPAIVAVGASAAAAEHVAACCLLPNPSAAALPPLPCLPPTLAQAPYSQKARTDFIYRTWLSQHDIV